MRALPRVLIMVAIGATLPGPVRAEPEPAGSLALVGRPETVFLRQRDACDGHDVPDAPARAFRDASGAIAMFGMHYENRALRGASLDALKLDCRVVLGSSGNPDPGAYDDKTWITATWTDDGRRVAALLHHEYQAHAHPGRCRFTAYMACWYNTVLGVSSNDGGLSFDRASLRVVAAAPFRQEVEQGRHRGFLNPSNIFGDGPDRYFFAATTGWDGQPHGACLFRSRTPADPSSWRAFDGQAFTIRYDDPYGRAFKPPGRACRPIAPFPAPVGAVVRHRATKTWVAVFQAKADRASFPLSGFYAAYSRDLVTWTSPRLLLAGATLYDDPCGSGGRLIAYPSLLDPQAQGRNFDDTGDTPYLFYATLKVEGCTITSDRDLVRQRADIKVGS